MSIQVTRNSGETVIKLPDRFVFSLQSEFRRAYEEDKKGNSGRRTYLLDFGRTRYIDSSALGMLLVLREQVGGEQSRIQIVNTSPAIRKILETARFQDLFHIG